MYVVQSNKNPKIEKENFFFSARKKAAALGRTSLAQGADWADRAAWEIPGSPEHEEEDHYSGDPEDSDEEESRRSWNKSQRK